MALSEINLDTLPIFAQTEADRVAQFDFRGPLTICANLIANDTRENFLKQVDPDKNATAPLKHPRSPNRGKDQLGRSAAGTTHQLWDTGRLAASYGAGSQDNINQVGRFELVFGSNHEHAAIHHNGANIPERRRTSSQKPWRFEISEWTPAFAKPAKTGKKGKAKRKLNTTAIFTYHIKQTTIPARPRCGIGKDLAEQIANVIGDFVAGQMFRAA